MLVLPGLADAEVAAFVSRETGEQFTLPIRTIGFASNEGKLLGGAVFSHYTGFGVELSGAGSALLSRTARQAIGDFVFGWLGCRRLSITVRSSNKKMQRLLNRHRKPRDPKRGGRERAFLGFHFEGKARRYYGNEDGIVYSMLVSEAVELNHWTPQAKVETETDGSSKAA